MKLGKTREMTGQPLLDGSLKTVSKFSPRRLSSEIRAPVPAEPDFSAYNRTAETALAAGGSGGAPRLAPNVDGFVPRNLRCSSNVFFFFFNEKKTENKTYVQKEIKKNSVCDGNRGRPADSTQRCQGGNTQIAVPERGGVPRSAIGPSAVT